MKLTELGNPATASTTARIMEQQFGSKIDVSKLDLTKTHMLLKQVQKTLREYKQTPNFHKSQSSGAYLKAIMLEQALTQHIREMDSGMAEFVKPGKEKEFAAYMQGLQNKDTKVMETTCDEDTVMELMDLAKSQLSETGVSYMQIKETVEACAEEDGGELAAKIYPMRERMEAARRLAKECGVYPMRESKRNLREASEVETAQCVLAAQDMVDRVQKMIEQTSEMQYKELPALVDSIKYDIGTDKAQQFQQQAQQGLQSLLDSLQQNKQSLDAALGTLTGVDSGAALGGGEDVGAELDVAADDTLPDLSGDEEVGAEISADAEVPELPELPAEDEPKGSASALGRERR